MLHSLIESLFAKSFNADYIHSAILKNINTPSFVPLIKENGYSHGIRNVILWKHKAVISNMTKLRLNVQSVSFLRKAE